jgi:hypothetical protein
MELLTKPFSMGALAAKVGEMVEGNCRYLLVLTSFEKAGVFLKTHPNRDARGP